MAPNPDPRDLENVFWDAIVADLDNLYVTDASFFPSSGAVSPGLTIIANASRVAAHIGQRL
jgi:choline dehydrogenase-like flavoprotein